MKNFTKLAIILLSAFPAVLLQGSQPKEPSQESSGSQSVEESAHAAQILRLAKEISRLQKMQARFEARHAELPSAAKGQQTAKKGSPALAATTVVTFADQTTAVAPAATEAAIGAAGNARTLPTLPPLTLPRAAVDIQIIHHDPPSVLPGTRLYGRPDRYRSDSRQHSSNASDKAHTPSGQAATQENGHAQADAQLNMQGIGLPSPINNARNHDEEPAFPDGGPDRQVFGQVAAIQRPIGSRMPLGASAAAAQPRRIGELRAAPAPRKNPGDSAARAALYAANPAIDRAQPTILVDQTTKGRIVINNLIIYNMGETHNVSISRSDAPQARNKHYDPKKAPNEFQRGTAAPEDPLFRAVPGANAAAYAHLKTAFAPATASAQSAVMAAPAAAFAVSAPAPAQRTQTSPCCTCWKQKCVIL